MIVDDRRVATLSNSDPKGKARKVRRDRADVFSTLAEGIKGKRAVQWNLVDGVFPPSTFDDKLMARAAEIAGEGHPDRKGVELTPLAPEVSEDAITYRHVTLSFGPEDRAAHLTLTVPDTLPEIPSDATELGADWWSLRAFRELDDALLRLRVNHPDVGLVLLHTRGDVQTVLDNDARLLAAQDHWFVREVLLHMKRVLKRLDLTAKTFFSIIDEGSCFAGSLFELTLAGDRSYMFEEDGVSIALSELNFGAGSRWVKAGATLPEAPTVDA